MAVRADGRGASQPVHFLRPSQALRPAPPTGVEDERCEMCARPVTGEHPHVVDLKHQRLLCACRECWSLFSAEGAGGGHYRAVPERYFAVSEGAEALALWESLEVPVGVTFLVPRSPQGRVCAFYPGPAGATESLLPPGPWQQLLESKPELATMADDVEALLLWADPPRSAAECFIVPVDACYELVGLLRKDWRGFDGGSEARQAMEDFFSRVRVRARAA
jgi:hypothetical protein